MAKSKSLASINDKLLADSTPIQDALRDLLNRKGPVSVLEIECDSGRALMELAWEFRDEDVHFHGHNTSRGNPLDENEDLLLSAREHGIGDAAALQSIRLPELHFGDPTRLELPDDSVDFVYVPSVVRYVRGKAELLEEVARVLAPDGVAYVRISGAGWDHPHCKALPEPQLSGNPCRLVLLHDAELVPLEDFLSLAGNQGLECEVINLPACVVRMTKRTPGPIGLALRADEDLTRPLRDLAFDEVDGRVKQGGFRSVYHVSDDAYRALRERGVLAAETLQPAGATRHRTTETAVGEAEERKRLERNRRILASFAVGQRVKVRGRRDDGALFRAAKVRRNEDEANREALEGPLEQVDAEAGVVEVLGIPVHLGNIERVKTWEGGKYDLGELEPGMFMKVKGKTVDGRFLAEKIKVIQGSPSASQEIQSFIGSLDLEGDCFQVGEMTIAIDAATKMEESEAGDA